jgi:hypothetical protein
VDAFAVRLGVGFGGGQQLAGRRDRQAGAE